MDLDFTPLIWLGAIVFGIPLFILGIILGVWVF